MIAVQDDPVMLEEVQPQRFVRTFHTQIDAQGVQVVRIAPQWTWQLEPVKRLLECLSLKENWDSYGGRPPLLQPVLKAIEFLDMIPYDNPPRPRIVPLSSGGIQLEWSYSGRELEIEFPPEGPVGFLGAENATDEQEGRVTSFSPADVRSLMAWLIAR